MNEEIVIEVARRLGAREPIAAQRVAAGMSSIAWRLELPDGPSIVRTPIPDSGRRPSNRSDVLIGRLLPAGLPVPRWEPIIVDGVECTVSPELPGAPVQPDRVWGPRLVDAVAEVLAACHALATGTEGWGPLENRDDKIVGSSAAIVDGVADRWFLASMWPFDGSSLESHAVTSVAPGLVDSLAALETDVLAASVSTRSLVHSDLHAEHLLVVNGELTGLLDFGDAFVGAAAWDIALLRQYYGAENALAVAGRLPDGDALREASSLLQVAVCAYKLAKQPSRVGVGDRLRQALHAATS